MCKLTYLLSPFLLLANLLNVQAARPTITVTVSTTQTWTATETIIVDTVTTTTITVVDVVTLAARVAQTSGPAPFFLPGVPLNMLPRDASCAHLQFKYPTKTEQKKAPIVAKQAATGTNSSASSPAAIPAKCPAQSVVVGEITVSAPAQVKAPRPYVQGGAVQASAGSQGVKAPIQAQVAQAPVAPALITKPPTEKIVTSETAKVQAVKAPVAVAKAPVAKTPIVAANPPVAKTPVAPVVAAPAQPGTSQGAQQKSTNPKA